MTNNKIFTSLRARARPYYIYGDNVSIVIVMIYNYMMYVMIVCDYNCCCIRQFVDALIAFITVNNITI